MCDNPRLIFWFFFWAFSKLRVKLLVLVSLPACIYWFKVNNWNTRPICELYSKLTRKMLERHHWRRSGVFLVNFEHISQIGLVFPLLTLSKYILAGTHFSLVHFEWAQHIQLTYLVTLSFISSFFGKVISVRDSMKKE